MDALMARLVELGVQCEDDMILWRPRTFRTLCHSFSAEDSLKLSKEIHKLHHSSEALALHLHLCHRVMICPQHHLRHYLPIPHLPTPHPLENRVENIKRTSTPGKRRAEGGEGEVQRKKKSRNSDRYGCVEWDVAVEGTESRAELLSKRNELKSAFKTHDPQESSVRKLMAETYPIQRETINDGTNVKVLKEEWPFLFEAAHLFDHASRLLGFSVQNKLAQELSKKEPGINNFLDTKGMKMGEGPVQLI
ncbi:Tubulin polyglutamylase ttll-5 [Dissostichus eleginoides]|uniref:Tubulin polyglutamylase ttll-5 n=1 Tax=Dissostichus eleginoides TaxID=100907 RepID=A0AAD9F900_DISEL|nr:Tubulin polyglutamylase ttll-5 [Dissostichus eleginoides]